MRRRSFTWLAGLFFVVKLVVNSASRFVYAFLPDIGRGLGISTGAAGALVSVRWAAGVATPLVVQAAGREHRRRVLGTGLGLFAAGALITAAFGVVAGAVVGFALMGVAKPVFDTGTQAVVADRVPYRSRGRVLGLLEMTWALGLLAGAPAAGWLIQRYAWSTPFLVAGAATAVLGVLVLRLAPSSVASDGPQRIVWDSASRAFMGGTLLLVGSIELIFITYAGWLEETHGFTLANLAWLAVVVGLAELIAEGATVAFTDRLGKVRAVIVGVAVAATGQVVLAIAGSALVIAAGGIVLAIAGFEFAFVSSISIGTELQPNARIQFLSRFVVAQAIGRGAAGLVGVGLFALWGMTAVGLGAAAMSVAAAFAVSRVRPTSPSAKSEADSAQEVRP